MSDADDCLTAESINKSKHALNILLESCWELFFPLTQLSENSIQH